MKSADEHRGYYWFSVLHPDHAWAVTFCDSFFKMSLANYRKGDQYAEEL